MQQCLNMEAEPPIVLIVDEVREFCPLADNPDNAVYCSNSGNEIPRIYIPLHDHEERRVWKHEFTHHILYENGEDENSELQDHKHAVWQCQWN